MSNKQIEALKLALEALEAVGHEYICQATHHKKKDRHGGFDDCPNAERHQKAITAIREALADHSEQHLDMVQPAQQQEPVAWMCTETKILYDHDTSEVDKYHGFKPTMPLYAHPAPQPSKPLTDEQIMEMYDKAGGATWISDFARAVEAAHGITGETQ